jgi:hypothetical protein
LSKEFLETGKRRLPGDTARAAWGPYTEGRSLPSRRWNGIVFILDQWVEPDAGVGTFQPMIPPAQHLLQEADLGVVRRKLRAGVSPRPDQAIPRTSQLFEQTRNGIGVAIGPAGGRYLYT